MRKSVFGFTLIELLVVIAIIGILSMISFVVYTNVLKSARLAKRVGDLKNIETALELYRSKNDYYPIAVSWRSECVVGDSVNADDVIPGLVPEYINAFPADPQMKKDTNESCYMYISNDDGTGYKLIDDKISEFSAEDYLKQRGMIDPARDGGSNNCRVDGTNPEAWGFYTYNACGL